MSQARETFSRSIADAENLLKHFDTLNRKPPQPEIEVLKRAGMVMAMTAWETYVEDCVLEAATARLRSLTDPSIATFVRAKLDEEIKRLNNPTADKTMQLFRDYAGVDLGKHWRWNNHDEQAVRNQLDGYIKLRGDVVHRSRAISPGPPESHRVKKADLKRAIQFLKDIVQATERALVATA